MRYIFLILTFLTISNIAFAKKTIVVTGYQIKLIVDEIAGDKVDVINLVSPSNSPHTYNPKPSQIVEAKKADILYYISDNLDSWVSKFNSKKAIELIDLLPKQFRMEFEEEEEHHHEHGHHHRNWDPHFWLSPIAVKELVPKITKIFTDLDKKNTSYYKEKAHDFIKRLEILDIKISDKLKKFKGENVFLFHPSFRYFLKQYDLNYAGSIEEFPGKEPSPKYLMELMKRLKAKNAKAIFTEPQLPENPAEAISKSTGLPLFVLDPIGGIKGRDSYEKLMMYNTNILVKAFTKK